MAKEIERKFLVDMTKLGVLPEGIPVKQGYVRTAGNASVRARLMGDKAFLTLKGRTVGNTRSEFEYLIPTEDAEQIIAELCNGLTVEKHRHFIEHKGHIWELDIFAGDNEGLIVAEIELKSEDELFALPAWVTVEVSGEAKYYNSSLLSYPFKAWTD